MAEDNQLEHLGKVSNTPSQKLDTIPWAASHESPAPTIRLTCNEFTSFCPVTNQPDFGKIVFMYQPKKFLVETKSLKLFLWSYRVEHSFNEALVRDMAEKFYTQVQPHWCRVLGEFNPRGGISLSADIEIGTFRKG